MVKCFVLKCKECGRERPYPAPKGISMMVKLRLEMGLKEHYVYMHPHKEPPNLRDVDIIELDVDDKLVKDIEGRKREAKWIIMV